MASRIPLIIVNKGQDLIRQIVPKVVEMAQKAGIQNIGQPSEFLPVNDDGTPNACLISVELQKMLAIRNQLINRLNLVASTTMSLAKTLKPLTTSLNAAQKGLKIASGARKVISIGATFIPSPPGTPGFVVSAINNLKNLEEFLFPIISLGLGNISSIEKALDYISKVFNKLISLLKSIDNYLIGCGVAAESLTPLNEDAKTLNDMQTKIQTEETNLNLYKGFVLEVVQEPFSPTVNRRKAIAKNKDNIILLQTPLSFTTLDEVLINEIKLLIDSNNLRAD